MTIPAISKPVARATVATRKATSKAPRPKYQAKTHSTAAFPADVESTPAYRYAQLDASGCYAELERRQLPAHRESPSWPGITQAVRLTGPVNGVTWRTDILEAERAQSPYELFDCRLVLALDDFTRILRAEGIEEVVFSSAYRPPPKSVGIDEQARRHSGGLAIDVHRMRHEDGHWIKVEQDFHGRIGAKVCTQPIAAYRERAPTHAAPTNAPPPSTPPTRGAASKGSSASHHLSPQQSQAEARRLRRIVCGAAGQRLFQSILTPNYDRPHRNHFHLELTVGVRWFIVS